jgi:glycosyltransferase involved in cell wall biosynthesis
MLVSAVIPTAGRRQAQLVAAVESVHAQTIANEVEIVVVDDSEGRLDADSIRNLGDTVVRIVRPDFGEAGRQAGVRAAAGPWIAFLDDDDIWEPRKLEVQLALAEQIRDSGKTPVVSCRVVHVMHGPVTAQTAVPSRVIQSGQSVAEYLFRNRSPSVGRASLFTSTLLTSRALCIEAPWRRIPRHQDWDWLLRAEGVRDTHVVHHDDVLARVAVGSPASISASADWKRSLDWANTMLAGQDASKVRADFLVSQTLRYALHARSISGVTEVLRHVLATGKVPSPTSALSGAAGVVPRGLIESVLRRDREVPSKAGRASQ